MSDASNTTVVIKTENLGKSYRLYGDNASRLKEAIDPFRRKRHTVHHALSGINLEIHKGETVGIIGVNGSGKSTLLKILTGVVTPSEGTLKVEGKLSALLELGAGFNPEYSGLENIYLNGTMMGFSTEEMKTRVPEIVAFADIGDFINQPVKTYSSGMFARLAFSVAISVNPDILVVDEALSVGDIFFQTKCFKKFEEFRQAGKTILFVSHDLSSINRYCSRAILLNKGKMIGDGTPKEIIDLYKKVISHQMVADAKQRSRKQLEKDTQKKTVWKKSLICNPDLNEYGNRKAEIVDFAILDRDERITNTVAKGEICTIKLRVVFHEPLKDPIIAITIKNQQGLDIAGTNTDLENCEFGPVDAGDCYIVTFKQRLTIQGGEYLLSFGCTEYKNDYLEVCHRLYDVTNLVVISNVRKIGFYDMEAECIVEKDEDID